LDSNGIVTHFVEKPQIPKSNMALVGVYKIRESEMMYDCLEDNIQKGLRSHGEFSISDALDCMIHKGVEIIPFKVESWFDCGKKDTLLESNATLLKKFGDKATICNECYDNTVLIPPVSIGANCVIRNSIIGPNVTIGENTTVDSSIIRQSIIGAYANLLDIVLDESLIGSDTSIRGESRTLNIGDNTNIDLG
jgi:glucose-1-phosphate thymidylyltransferase